MNNHLAFWGLIGDRDSQIIGEFWGLIPRKYLNVGLGTGTKFLGNLQTLIDSLSLHLTFRVGSIGNFKIPLGYYQ